MKNIKKYISIVLTMVAMIAVVGCDDFEDEVAYTVEPNNSSRFEILEYKADNTFKIKVEFDLKTELKNEKLSDIEVVLRDYYETLTQKGQLKEVNGTSTVSAIFDGIQLGNQYSVYANIKGKYLDKKISEGYVFITSHKLLGVSSAKQVLAAPDSISFELALDRYDYLSESDVVKLSFTFNRESEEHVMYASFCKSDISDNGTVSLGFPTNSLEENRYEVTIRNQKASDKTLQKSSVDIPASTASFRNMKASVDFYGMHITGEFDKGNLACQPNVGTGNTPSIVKYLSDTKFEISGIYPPFDTEYSVSVLLNSYKGKSILSSLPFDIKSEYKRYGIDMGGDMIWAACNEGASNPYQLGYTYYRSSCINGDEFWALPSKADFTELTSITTREWSIVNGIYGWRVTSKNNGNSIFMPASANSYNSGCYWLKDTDYNNYSNRWYYIQSSNNYFRVDYSSQSYLNNTKYYVRYVLPKNVLNTKEITLDKSQISLYTGCQETLTATLLPAGITNVGVKWSSSNTNVATVSDGVITAVAPGKCTITVSTWNPGVTGKCEVTVEDDAIDLGLSVKWRAYNYCAKSVTDVGTQMKGGHSEGSGSKWKVPTEDQYNELFNNCSYERVEVDGVNCIRYTSKVNGNTLLMPVTDGYWTSSTSSYTSYSSIKKTCEGYVSYVMADGIQSPKIYKISATDSYSESWAISTAYEKRSYCYRFVCE